MPFDTPPIMKVRPLEESYLLLDYLFYHTISYVTVSFNLFLFLSLYDNTTIDHMVDCCVTVYFFLI